MYDDPDDFDDQDDLLKRRNLHAWLIFLVIVDLAIVVGYFLQYLSATDTPTQTDSVKTWSLLILSLFGIPKIVGSIAIFRDKSWGIIVYGVGCIGMMMDAFALVESGPLPVAIALGSVAMLWLTVYLSKEARIIRP